MNQSTLFKSILSGSLWGIIAKVLDALAKFVTIPMLVGFYGKVDYGLIALAFSLNAYLRLMDIGMNIGSVRFFSMWIAQEEWDKIGRVSRSSVVFYGVIGIINALVFVVMGHTSGTFFKLSPEQIPVFKWMMYILAASTVFNWISSVVTQLLNAHGQQGWVNRVTVVSSIFNFVTAFVAVKFNLSLSFYFLLYILSTLMVIPLNVYKLKVYPFSLSKLLMPKWDGKAFKEILGYSIAIFAIGIFQLSADNLRPILLGKYASRGIEVLTEYRVIQTITALVIAFGAVFMQVLLPSATKVYAENNKEKLEQLVYGGTKYITVFLSLTVFMLIVNAKTILNMYMGPGYDTLAIWLIIWLLTVLISMHNAPVASLVLSTGKTKFLVYSSAIACILSLPITAVLAGKYNVGSAVIGYCIYVLLQIGFYYCYYIPAILKLNVKKLLFSSFLLPVLAGVIGWAITTESGQFIRLSGNFKTLIFTSAIFTASFLLCTRVFVLNRNDIREFKRKIARN